MLKKSRSVVFDTENEVFKQDQSPLKLNRQNKSNPGASTHMTPKKPKSNGRSQSLLMSGGPDDIKENDASLASCSGQKLKRMMFRQ